MDRIIIKNVKWDVVFLRFFKLFSLFEFVGVWCIEIVASELVQYLQ